MGAPARRHREPIAHPARSLGLDGPRPDLALAATRPTLTTFPGQTARIPFLVEATDLDPLKPEILLKQASGEILARTRVEVRPGAPARGVFEVTAPEQSAYWTVETAVVPGELRPANNVARVHLRLLQSRTRVFLAEGAPYWDSKFLAQLLRQQEHMEVHSVHRLSEERFFRIDTGEPDATETDAAIFPETLEALAAYDLVVFGKNIESFLTPARLDALRRYVRDQGGAVLFARGKSTSTSLPALEALEPVRWAATRTDQFRFIPTPDGEAAGLFGQALPAIDASIWTSLPPLQDARSIEFVKPFTRILAEGTTEQALGDARLPALLVRRYGRGACGLVNGDGLWKWDFYPEARELGNLFEAFWTELIQWMASYSEFLPGQDYSLRLPASRGEMDEPVTARVSYRGTTTDPQPTLHLTAPDGEITELRPAPQPDPGGRPTWRATFTPDQPGQWQVRVRDPRPDAPPTPEAGYRIAAPPREADDLTPDPAFLTTLADSTGGGLLDPASLSRFVAEAMRPRPPAATDGRAVWQPSWTRAPLALVIATLLAALPLVLLSSLAPRAFGIVLHRLTHPSSDLPPWSPLHFTLDPAAPTCLYGGPLDLTVDITGRDDLGKVECLVRRPGSAEIRRLPAFRESATRFSRTLEGVTESIDVAFACGPARSAWHPVELLLQPKVLAGEVRITPPAYTRLPPQVSPLDRTEIAALEGSQVTLQLRSNRPLGPSSLVFTPAATPGETPLPETIAGVPDGVDTIAFDWTATRSGRLAATLRDVRGTASAAPLELAFRCVPDQPPVVELASPPRLMLATPRTLVPVEGTAEDDHALARVAFVRTLQGFRDRARPLARELRDPQYQFTSKLDLTAVSVTPGQTIELFLEAARQAHAQAAEVLDRLAEDFPAFEIEERLQQVAREQADKVGENLKALAAFDPQGSEGDQRGRIREMRRRLGGDDPPLQQLQQDAQLLAEAGKLLQLAAEFQRIYTNQKSVADRIRTITKELAMGNDANRRMLPALAATQRKNREALDAFAKQLTQRAEAVRDPALAPLRDSALDFAQRLALADPASVMDLAAESADLGQANDAFVSAELARGMLESLMAPENPFCQACQGSPKFSIPRPDVNRTLQQLLEAMMCQNPGTSPNSGTGGGGMGLGGSGPTGNAQPGFASLDIPVLGPERRFFDPPSMAAESRGGGQGPATSQLAPVAEKATLSPSEQSRATPAAPDLQAVPEAYREAVKAYFTTTP